MLRLHSTSLAFALDYAARAVAAVRAGTALPAALSSLFDSINTSDSDRSAQGAIQDIAYRTLRVLGCVDALIARLMRKRPAPPVANLLTCALALLIDPPEAAGYPSFTVVDQAVCAIGARREYAYAKGVVNAVLRRFLRSQATWLSEVTQEDPVARWNAPNWWIEAVKRAWPTQWQAILAMHRTLAPMTLRVNRRHLTATDYLNSLSDAQIPAMITGPVAVQLIRPVPVAQLPGFSQGWVSVQDEGAQRAAPLLAVQNGMRVLDACAAPGGKTGHLLELAEIGLDLIAVEKSRARAARIHHNLNRLKLATSVSVCIGDAGIPKTWWDGRLFDRILVDVPCSASGVVRRHPDICWLRRATDIQSLASEQRRLLTALWPLLKPGGQLLYASCSIFPEEGEQQAQWLECTQQARRLDAPGQLLPSISPDHDGFFYARFQKR